MNFNNTVVIMTSNIASESILELGDSNWELAEQSVMDALQNKFKPEFLNRVDDVIIYKPLSRENLGRIVDLQLDRVRSQLLTRNLALRVESEVRADLLAEAYDPKYGARPLKRTIQRRLQNPIALALLAGDFVDGDTIIASRSDDGTVKLSKIKSNVQEHAGAGI